MKFEDIDDTTKRIQEAVKKQLSENLEIVDNTFSLENLDYVQNELANDKIREIYQLLGPVDYNLF